VSEGPPRSGLARHCSHSLSHSGSIGRPDGLALWSRVNGCGVACKFAVDDEALTELHGRAFGNRRDDRKPWAARLDRYSLTWVGAFAGDELVGFVHACWDGGRHAFLLDAVVDPGLERQGIGKAIVQRLVSEVQGSGCEWLHVDCQPALAAFYEDQCGFRHTPAALMRLGFVGDVVAVFKGTGAKLSQCLSHRATGQSMDVADP
jgi:GNAT superfamily N-acetyltransferase